MKYRLAFGILLLIITLPVVSYAQGSGSVEPATPPSRGGIDLYEPPFVVIRSVSGKIVDINVAEQIIVVETKDGKLFKFGLDKKAKLKADKGTELGGKKKLTLEDFANGQLVKVTFIPTEKRVMEVRIRREKG